MGTLASGLVPLAAAVSEAPRIYVDANVPSGAVGHMRSALGWDVLFVLEEPEWRRASDREHYARARDLGRTLITLDHDFFDDGKFPPELSPGVIVCTAADERALVRLLKALDRRVFHERGLLPPLVGRKLDWHLGVC